LAPADAIMRGGGTSPGTDEPNTVSLLAYDPILALFGLFFFLIES